MEVTLSIVPSACHPSSPRRCAHASRLPVQAVEVGNVNGVVALLRAGCDHKYVSVVVVRCAFADEMMVISLWSGSRQGKIDVL